MDKIGMNAHIPDNKTLDLIKKANLSWIRCDFNWINMEPEKGKFNFKETDRVVDFCKANDIQVFPTLAYAPKWANGGQPMSTPATNANDWMDFIKEVVKHYKGYIKVWGLWNEPNLEEFFNGRRDEYINRILIPGNAAAKDADPGCQTAGPEISTLQKGDWWSWIADMAKQQEHFDIFTIHNYSESAKAMKTKLEKGSFIKIFPYDQAIVKLLKQIDKPKWLTEVGWTTNSVGLQNQAEYYQQSCEYIKTTTSFKKIFFYQMIDEQNLADKWGIVNVDYSPKQAFQNLKAECA